MAIKYSELKEELENAPLSTIDLSLIKDVENYIDDQIIEKFDKSIYGEIRIDVCYINFKYSPTTKKSINNLGVSRIPKMKAELERRFKEAGWVITYEINDGYGACGADYMVLKGKK